MTKQQITAIAGLLLLAMLLTVLIGVFDARRRFVAAEGNDLRSGQSAWVTATIDELMRARRTFEPGTKVFVGLDGDVRAVVVLSGQWTDVPLHDGHALTGRPGEALVGAAVDVRDEDITVGGTTYEVVGRLGVRADSLLSDDVVLADPAQFSASPQRLLLDGPSSAHHYSAQFPGRSVEVIDAARTAGRTSTPCRPSWSRSVPSSSCSSPWSPGCKLDDGNSALPPSASPRGSDR